MAYLDSTVATSGGTTSLACSAPAGLADGDVLVAGVIVGHPATVTEPSGWSLVYSSGGIGTGPPDRQVLVYTKVAASEPGSWTWTISTTTGAVIEVVALTGRDPTAVPDDEAGQVNASSSSVTAPSITTTVDACDLVGIFGADGSRTFTAPGGMTEREDAIGGGRALSLCTEVLGAAGSTGTRVATASGADENVGWIGAFAPLVAGGEPSLLLA